LENAEVWRGRDLEDYARERLAFHGEFLGEGAGRLTVDGLE
jgi:hypothetical protein